MANEPATRLEMLREMHKEATAALEQAERVARYNAERNATTAVGGEGGEGGYLPKGTSNGSLYGTDNGF